jgi:predicted peroxiredoxin
VAPFEVRSDNTLSITTTKCYTALFICIGIKAMHLELLFNLTSESLIVALKSFVARTELVGHLYSDNRSNFVGASR